MGLCEAYGQSYMYGHVDHVKRHTCTCMHFHCIKQAAGHSNFPLESDDPWYSKSKVSEEGAKSKRLKELMDPLNDMKRFVSQTKKLSDDHSTATGGRGVVPTILAAPGTSSHSSMAKGNPVASGKSTVDQESRKCTKSHKHHKEHKSKSKHKKKDLKEKEREKDERLEELRRQRRKREEAERAKAEALLRGRHSRNGMEGRDSGTSQAVEDSSRRYIHKVFCDKVVTVLD